MQVADTLKTIKKETHVYNLHRNGIKVLFFPDANNWKRSMCNMKCRMQIPTIKTTEDNRCYSNKRELGIEQSII